MNKKNKQNKKILIVSIFFATILLLVTATLFLRKTISLPVLNNNSSTSSGLSDQKSAQIELINKFYMLQQSHNAREVLSLFTPPNSVTEKKDLNFLLGADLNDNPRLYSTAGLNYSIDSYKILSIENNQNNNQVVLVEETHFLKDNTSEKTYFETNKYEVLLVQELIEAYRPLTNLSDSSGKYDGFFY